MGNDVAIKVASFVSFCGSNTRAAVVNLTNSLQPKSKEKRLTTE